jgi:hypothetical protein
MSSDTPKLKSEARCRILWTAFCADCVRFQHFALNAGVAAPHFIAGALSKKKCFAR